MKKVLRKFMDKFCLSGERALRIGLRSGSDRRDIKDRRRASARKYFSEGGDEKRDRANRRQQPERRQGWARVSEWTSIFNGRQ